MKNQICIRTSQFVSQLESAFRQLCAVLTPYLIADNLSGIQINNSTNIVILFIVPEECDIKFGEAMHRAFQKETTNASEKYGYNLVKEHFERRNKIAHQNDREHSSAIQITITKEYVEQ